MAQEIINVGTLPNDGEGDPLRVAFQKINNNFSQLFSTGFLSYQATTFTDTPNQVIFEVPANVFTQATFQINSANPDTNDSQNITINASIKNDLSDVRWTGHSSIIIENPVTQYNMIVEPLSGNVQLLINPLANVTLNHFISAQVENAVFAPVMLSPSLLTEPNPVTVTDNGLVITIDP